MIKLSFIGAIVNIFKKKIHQNLPKTFALFCTQTNQHGQKHILLEVGNNLLHRNEI